MRLTTKTKTTRKESDVKLRTLLSKRDAAPWKHVDTFIPSLFIILIECCKPMVKLNCWLQTSTCHSVAAHERSSNFNTTMKTSTESEATLRSSLRSVCWRCRTSKLRQPLLPVPTTARSLSLDRALESTSKRTHWWPAGWPLPNGLTLKNPDFITWKIAPFSPLLHEKCIHLSNRTSHVHVFYLPSVLGHTPNYRRDPGTLQCRPQIKGCCIIIIVLPTLTIGICMHLWSCCGTIRMHSESKTVFPSIQLPVSCSCSLLASFVLASPQLRDPGHCTVDLKARVGCCISLMLRLWQWASAFLLPS